MKTHRLSFLTMVCLMWGCASTPQEQPSKEKVAVVQNSTVSKKSEAKPQEQNGTRPKAVKQAQQTWKLKIEEEREVDTKGFPFEATGPVAIIAGKPVSKNRFNAEVERIKNVALNPDILQPYKMKVLKNVVADVIFEIKAEELGVVATSQDIQEKERIFRERFEAPEDYDAFVKKLGYTREGLRHEFIKGIIAEKVVAAHYPTNVREEDIKKHYEKNKNRYGTPAQVKASHILLKVPKSAKKKEVEKRRLEAVVIAKQAKAGADFAELARKHSEGPSGPKGGDLGFFPAMRMVPEFAKAAFALNVGEVSDPVLTVFGWHVIKVFKKKAMFTPEYGEIRLQIFEELSAERKRKARRDFLADMHKKMRVKYEKGNIRVN